MEEKNWKESPEGDPELYKKAKLVDVVRISPEYLTDELEDTIYYTLWSKLEGRLDKEIGKVIAVTRIISIGEGHILTGDGAVYYEVEFEAILFKPEMQEVVDGEVIDIANFGAFVRVGPLDALIHVSQVTDDFMSYDSKSQRLVGKENNKSLIVGDKVRARIIALSINETDPNKNKIAMTMRQVGLGKLEWLDDAIKKDKK